MRLPQSLAEFREEMRRFVRTAVAKQARLVVFPELAGVMVAPPLLADTRSRLLKLADRGRGRRATLWQRMVGQAAGAFAALVQADFRRGLAGLLDVDAAAIWQAYNEVFGGLAREEDVTLVAPSAYLPDPQDGVIRNLAAVFGRDGQRAGYQTKVILHPADAGLAQAGRTWDVIETEVGRIGLILGSDVLFPEVGRLLAYQGADILIVQAAPADQTLYNKVRAGALARMQDNQLFAAASYLVGGNRFSRGQHAPFVGKSAILAPQELTPRANGVLVEMGSVRSEGIVTAEWDFAALRELWETSDTPVRSQLPLQQAGQELAQLYAKLQTLPRLSDPAQLPSAAAPALPVMELAPADEAIQDLDDLVVIGSVTSRWPLTPPTQPTIGIAPVDEIADATLDLSQAATAPVQPRSQTEDETDEMDALGTSGPAREGGAAN
jgi:predicted amidohydrolase